MPVGLPFLPNLSQAIKNVLCSCRNKKRGGIPMKTKLSKILFTLMCALVGIVQITAALAAGGASFATSYQPKVPAKLRK